MSVNTVERVLWEFGNRPERVTRFRADPAGYLAAYPLTSAEREMIQRMDLRALADHGVSSLLTIMVWPLLHGADEMPFDYLVHMNHGKLPDMGMTGFKAFGLKGYIRFRQVRAWLRRKRAGAFQAPA